MTTKEIIKRLIAEKKRLQFDKKLPKNQLRNTWYSFEIFKINEKIKEFKQAEINQKELNEMLKGNK
jgi:hypothetical protein